MTIPPAPLTAVDLSVWIESQCFRLLDPSTTGDVLAAVDGLTDDTLVSVAGTAAAFLSGDTGHTAAVRAECWPVPPPVPAGYEALSPVLPLANTSGEIVIDSLTGGREARRLTLPTPGPYQLRAARRDRQGEQWLIQLWTDTATPPR
ncbi:hypothetical protein Acy02nite_82170 [Actinoplanes cyaneus]|uniref:Uncharacterized protein n=1 Tax=Actinoplanes cyaneus TaxID=52696 RepID=A0A919ISA7_9ACTN|nr:hypothetical protein [Actinoplanes cyaneus]MCW2143482.1 hypothetical protein [Actinoplanes cyaneus]GID70336.1 hypothetical protein Acy02nite_82170 [Actinoplanes cyaneus]